MNGCIGHTRSQVAQIAVHTPQWLVTELGGKCLLKENVLQLLHIAVACRGVEKIGSEGLRGVVGREPAAA